MEIKLGKPFAADKGRYKVDPSIEKFPPLFDKDILLPVDPKKPMVVQKSRKPHV